MIPYRFLNRQSVSSFALIADSQGFVCGWLYAFAFSVDYPHKAAIFADYLSYWVKMDETWKNAIAILFFLFIPPLINLLMVRIYGELEFWLTLIKIIAIVGLIIAGIVIAAGGVPSPLLGTNSDFRPVPCSENNATIGPCLSPPGFECCTLYITDVDG